MWAIKYKQMTCQSKKNGLTNIEFILLLKSKYYLHGDVINVQL